MDAQAISEVVRSAAQKLRTDLAASEAELDASADEESIWRGIAAALDECLAALCTTDLWGPDNRLPSSELWNAVGELLCRGWLQNQARIKPRGYAGDYEMLARIYENRLCDDRLGRHFDRYFQCQTAPQAVRNRMALMTGWIVEAVRERPQPLKIAFVGSALGLEARDALRLLDEHERQRLSVTLLDMDPAALDFARAQIGPLLPTDRLATIPTNVFRVADRPLLAKPLEEADLVFCPGLFDYLDDAQASAMLQTLWERLAPRGQMTVFQFAPHNPTRAYMEWLGNWYLIYRDEVSLRQSVSTAGIPAEAASFGAEPLGVDLFVTATRR